MIPMQGLTLEKHGSEYGKNNQSYHLLHHLELHECKRATIVYKADTIGWHLKYIFR